MPDPEDFPVEAAAEEDPNTPAAPIPGKHPQPVTGWLQQPYLIKCWVLAENGKVTHVKPAEEYDVHHTDLGGHEPFDSVIATGVERPKTVD